MVGGDWWWFEKKFHHKLWQWCTLFLSCEDDLEQGGEVGNDDVAAHPVSPFPRSRVASPSSLAECDRPLPALVPEERRRLSSCPDFGNGLDCWL